MRGAIWATAIAAMMASAPASAAEGPSFDCSKARTAVDRAICADRELSRLDRGLAQLFRLALETQNDRRPLIADEQRWVVERSQCDQLAPADINFCISETILTRIQDLATIAHVQPKSFMAALDARERQQDASPFPPLQPLAAPVAHTASTEQVRPAVAQDLAPRQNDQSIVPAASPVDRKALLVAAVEKGRQAYATGANDMAKGAARPGRARDICAAMTSPVVEKWTGTIATLSSNGDGLGVMSVKIDGDVALMTWNNSLSDLSDHTLIDPNSSVFRKASMLKVGQKVVFSGIFIPSATDCFREGSLTLSGSLESPEFIFRFSDISPAE